GGSLRGTIVAAAESRDRDNTSRCAAEGRACGSTRCAWCAGWSGAAALEPNDVTCGRRFGVGNMVARPPAARLYGAISVYQRRSQAIGNRGKLKAAARRANCLERYRRRTADIDSIAAVLGADFSRLCATPVAPAASLDEPRRPAGPTAHPQRG